MADNVAITAGAGTVIATDQIAADSSHAQLMKLAISADGDRTLIPADAANGLDVDVTRVGGNVTVVQATAANLKVDASGVAVPVTDNAGSLTVDAPVGTPVFVRLSDGSTAIAALPVTDNAGSLTVDAPAATPVAIRLSDGATFVAAALEHATAASPHSNRLSDGTSFYDAAKTGQLPAALVGGRLDVNIGAGTVTVQDGAGSITVDSAQLPAALVGGRLDVVVGAALPTGTNIIGLAKLVDTAGVNVAAVSAANALKVDGSATTQPVSGTVTANQGTAAVVGNAWPVKVSDGTDTVGISTVGGNKALKIDVVQDVGNVAIADKAGFTEGTTKFNPVGAVYNDTIGSDPTEDQGAALRITQKRGLHVNLRNNAGTEIATAGNPARIDPTGTTTQPVLDTNSAAIKTAVELIDDPVIATAAAVPTKAMMAGGTDGTNARHIAVNASGHVKVEDGGNSLTIDGTVTANQGTANATPWNENLSQVGGTAVVTAAAGVQRVGIADEANAAFSQTNPLPVEPAGLGQTPVRKQVSYTAGQTDIALWTPGAGKKFIIVLLSITATGAGTLKLFDNTDAAGNYFFFGTTTVGMDRDIAPGTPLPSSTANNVLRYTSGAGSTGDIVVVGYEV